ncbi:lysosomal cholesterol signaling protein-like isoform X2 [Littorina saxatilis]|uniref:DEP domain-containing protein n=1 Tax=Littorina saxatilis TaxID=31220 RepID=A0AAN9BS67_9CAEN
MLPDSLVSSTPSPTPPFGVMDVRLPSNDTGGGGGGIVSIDNLYPAILQCFVVVASGYVAGRTGHVTASQGRGIATFVSTFCLPALLFQAMCTLNFSQVNWHFLLAILIAKMTVFVIVAALTLLVKRPLNLGLAGLFAIFCTQSNDFALGYPILQALYQNTHPEYLQYIYLISPISLLILNPIGFTLMEIHRHRTRHSVAALTSSDAQDESTTRRKRQDSTRSTDSTLRASNGHGSGGVPPEEMTWGKAFLQVSKGVLLNPIIFMTAIGVAGNFIFHQSVPAILDSILTVLGNAFSASALFYLGLSMVGKVKSQMGLGLMVPVLLIFAKSLLLPMVTWEVVSWLQPNETASRALSMYGFLYGTFPTAPSVLLYATHYSMAQDIVTTGMVAGTFLSAPLMFVSAKMMTVVVSSAMDYRSLLLNASFDSAIIGIVCCVWVLGVLVLSSRWRQVPHRFTFCLVLSQLLACIGMVSFNEVHTKTDWRHYAQFVTLLVGVFASRCWTAALALSLCLLHVRSLCSVLKAQVWFAFLGFGFPVLMTGLLFLLGAKHISDKVDPSFHYGFLQTVFSAVVLAVSFLVTVVSIVVWQREERHHAVGSRYTAITSESTPPTSTPAMAGADANHSATPAEQPGMNVQQSICSPPLSPSNMQRNYQACAAPINCSTVNIEDIIPFPSAEDTKSVMSDGSCTEDHGMLGSGVVPIDERTCLLSQCTTDERLACRQRLRRYAADQPNTVDSPQEEEAQDASDSLREEYQSTHHLLLLLLLSISMFVGLFLCIWKIFTSQVSGIYVEIEFLDSVFNYGQPIFVFIVFGFDTRLVFSPIMRRIRRWMYGAELVRLPQPWELDDDTQATCQQFVNFHIGTCRDQICKDRRFRLRRYQNVFTGAELCDWLIEAGLAMDKAEAVAYGRRLLLGRVIAHVTGVHHFQHSPFFYTFVDSEDSGQC